MVLVAIYRRYLCHRLRKNVRTPGQRLGRLFESIWPANRRNDSRARHDLLAQEHVLLECLGMAGSSYLRNPRPVTRGRVRCLLGLDRRIRTSSTDIFFFSFFDTFVHRPTSVLIPLIGTMDCRLAEHFGRRPD